MLDILTGKEIESTSQDKNIAQNLAQPRRVKLTDHPSEVCPKCGGKLFVEAVVIKDIPGIEVGNPTMDKVPMPVDQVPIFVCAKCGELAPMMSYNKDLKDAVDKLLEIEEDKENK